jgi:short-subunit dehydrogenase
MDPGRPPFQPRHALLTGAAGAIGGALARVLLQRHPTLRLTLVDRDGDGLQRLLSASASDSATAERCLALPCDLSAVETLPELWARSTARFGAVDLLVNCAGFMEIRSFAATPWELGERLLTVDLVAPLRLMKLAVDGMPDTGGALVNVSSMAGRVPLRGCSYYGAAKSGLALASRIAGLELRERGIHVLTVLPGPVASRLSARARAQVRPGFASRHIPTGDPETLARRIVRALERGRSRLVYPAVYALADRCIGLSSAFTAAFSPPPTE